MPLDGSAAGPTLRARGTNFSWEAGGASQMYLNASTGSLSVMNQVVAAGALLTSDRRLKSAIAHVEPRACTDALAALDVRSYLKKGHCTRQFGLLAQEVEEVPLLRDTVQILHRDGLRDCRVLDVGQLVPLLVACIKDLAARVAHLETVCLQECESVSGSSGEDTSSAGVSAS